MIIIDALKRLFDWWWLGFSFGRLDYFYWQGLYIPDPDVYKGEKFAGWVLAR